MHNHGVAVSDAGGVARARAVVCYLAKNALDAPYGVMGGEGEREGVEDRAGMKCVADVDRDGVAMYGAGFIEDRR